MSDRPSVLIEGSRAVYRASAAGSCIKSLSALRMGMDPLPPSDDMRRRFADGHLHEGPILEAVEKELNQSVVRRQEEWTIEMSSRVSVVGHVDGIMADDLMPVEAKSAAQDPFMDWDASPTKWFSARPYYAVQWTLTLAAYDRTSGVYAVKNKNTGRTVVREVEAPMKLAEVKTKLLRADLFGRQGKLPECDTDDKWGCPLRYLHDDKPRDDAETDEAMEGLVLAYDEAREAAKRTEAVQKELGARLKDVMGERERVDSGEFQIAIVPWTRVSWDQDKLRETLGDISPFQNVNSGMSLRVTRKRVEE